MFGSHSHSHNGAACKHSHGAANLGFGDEDENTPNIPPMNPMMMAMMQQMKNSTGNDGTMALNPMAMMMQQAQNNPQMKEIFSKMFEYRQQMMKEFMEKGGQTNPEAVKELMQKAAEVQSKLMQELKDSNTSNNPTPTTGNKDSKASNLLGGNLNNSNLDDLINKRNLNQRLKEEEEKKIMEAIENKDYTTLNAIKATQYGILERLKELIESGQTDPNKPDSENVYLLHWAAINNRLEIAKYLIELGVKVDAIGGELETTALNWAARSGHIHMCILLIQNGADPNLPDIEGYSTIHVASMFGHSNVVAYLLVKGIDPDFRDKSGTTPLMFAAQRVHSRDPAQLLITFNANLNAQDSKGNTPLHYAVAFNNATVMDILLNKGASQNIPNNKGQNALALAIERNKINAANFIESFQEGKDHLPSFLRPIARNKEFKKFFTRLYPFLVLYYIIYVIQLSGHWSWKLLYISFLYGLTYVFRLVIFDRFTTRYFPMALASAFIFWLYATWFMYFRPIVGNFSLYTMVFLFVTLLSWYNFYKSYSVDPGNLISNQESMKTTILKLVEQNEFSLDQFCSSCIIRKPLRSKHCGECDRCVAKFDHHCPWVDNCVGAHNLKYFVGFVFWTPICLLFFMDGAIAFYHDTCYPSDLESYPHMGFMREVVQFLKCSSWVSFFSIIAVFNLFWIGALGICHIYQTVFLAMTTNERLNYKRYKYFTDKNGNFKNPFNFGIFQNFADLLEFKFLCLKPNLINWKREYDIQDIHNYKFDKKKGSPYDV